MKKRKRTDKERAEYLIQNRVCNYDWRPEAKVVAAIVRLLRQVRAEEREKQRSKSLHFIWERAWKNRGLVEKT